MARYVMIKHYRGAPESVEPTPMDQWEPHEVDAHVEYMNDFADRLTASGEFVDSSALSASGAWVRSDGPGLPPLVDGPLPEEKDLVAGWMIIDVAGYDRAVELAGELSEAPGPGGRPIREWLELRPFIDTTDQGDGA